jgi:hypothetical protein
VVVGKVVVVVICPVVAVVGTVIGKVVVVVIWPVVVVAGVVVVVATWPAVVVDKQTPRLNKVPAAAQLGPALTTLFVPVHDADVV